MNKKLLALMGCVLIAGSAIAAEDNGGYEFHGYGRSGASWDGVNKDIPTHPRTLVGRLGIQNDTYWEMGLTKNFKMDDGGWAKATVMINQFTTNWNNENGGLTAEQIYSEIGGMSMLGEASVWAGKRFYYKRDIHVNDLFYTDYSGTGGGIDNVKTSFGTFGLGVIGQDYDDNNNTTTTRDTSISTFLVNYKISGFDIDLAASKAQGTKVPDPTGTKPPGYVSETDMGFQGLVQYNLGSYYGIGNGFVNTFVQYGLGLSSGAGLGSSKGSIETTASANSLRFGTYGLAALDDNWDLFTSIWGRMDNDLGDYTKKGNSLTQFSVVARPVYSFNKNFALQFEAGYGMVTSEPSKADKDLGAKSATASFYKATLAPTFKLDTTNFFARPEVRFFVTYTGYTNDSKYATTAAKDKVMSENGNGEVTTGVQMEMWF